jgi:hypothetical protein
MRKFLLPSIGLLFASLVVVPFSGVQSDESTANLKQVDSRANFMDSDFAAEYAITQSDPGEGKTFTKVLIFKRDRKEQFMALLVEPVEDKGKGYLMVEGGIWLYDPRDRRFTYSSTQDAFRNTNARNSDFAVSKLASQYRIVASKKEKLGVFDCDRLDLEATTPDAPFPRRSVWISTDNSVRMSKDYSLSGQLLRTVAFQYVTLAGRLVPSRIVMQDELKKKIVGGKEEKASTSIVITKHSFASLPDSLFTKEYLERIGR